MFFEVYGPDIMLSVASTNPKMPLGNGSFCCLLNSPRSFNCSSSEPFVIPDFDCSLKHL